MRNAEARLELWRSFLCLRIYCILLNEWIKWLLVPTALILKAVIALCLYVVLRREGIPGWLAIVSGYAGLMLGGIFLWDQYKAVSGMRLADDLAQRLTSTREEYFRRLAPEQQRYFVKLGKAVRVPRFEFGSFMEYSFEVPLTILDEILGQLLFLLSL